MSNFLDWLIIGGGIHGTHISHMLTAKGVKREKLRVLDPHPTPLWMWNHCTGNSGMKFLRSSLVHHIGLRPMELAQLSRNNKAGQKKELFQGYYSRPSYTLFQDHCSRVIKNNNLEELRLQGKALSIQRIDRGWMVTSERGTIKTKRIVLSLGLGDQPMWPEWIKPFRNTDCVNHLLDPKFSVFDRKLRGKVAVVGSGMTAVQAALSLARRGQEVVLLHRSPLRIHEFDSAPCYIGAKCMTGFWKTSCPKKRRSLIQQARHPGSVTPQVAAELNFALREGLLREEICDVQSAQFDNADTLTANPGGPHEIQAIKHLLLGTGLEKQCPSAPLLTPLIKREKLATAPCGYPLLGTDLQWAPGLFVSGPLAELELGPTSRNIIGARHSAERLCAVA